MEDYIELIAPTISLCLEIRAGHIIGADYGPADRTPSRRTLLSALASALVPGFWQPRPLGYPRFGATTTGPKRAGSRPTSAWRRQGRPGQMPVLFLVHGSSISSRTQFRSHRPGARRIFTDEHLRAIWARWLDHGPRELRPLRWPAWRTRARRESPAPLARHEVVPDEAHSARNLADA